MLKNKRGISVIIGYVLLIAIVTTISIIVYQWLRTYVPADSISCPDGVSVSIYNYSYNCGAGGKYSLNFTLGNTGTFSVAGYFVHAANDVSQIAAIDLSNYYDKSNGADGNNGNGIVFPCINRPDNTCDPNSIDPETEKGQNENKFDLSSLSSTYRTSLKRIEITPIRYVDYKGNSVPASCINAKIIMSIDCTQS